MFRGYRALFAPPGAFVFALFAMFARFPVGMFSLATTMLVTSLHGSYSLAGLGGAVTLVTVSVTGPQQARLVDQYGQSRVSVPAVLIATLGGAGQLVALYTQAPGWVYLLGCALAGLGPNTGAMTRARWAHLHKGDEGALHTAYAYEGVADELCFVLGPLAALALITAFSPLAAFLTAASLSLFGVVALATQGRTEPPPTGAAARADGRSALLSAGMPALVLMLAGVGAVFGIMEITTVGFAQAHGDKAAASVALSCYSLGSCLSGLALGMWQPRGRSVTRVRWALAAMALLLAPLMLVHSLPQVSAVLFVAGFATAPTMSTSMGLVRELVPEGKLTEGFTWASTGLLVGISLGTSTGGWAVDHLPTGAGYRVPAMAALLALLLSVRLVPADRRQPHPVP